MSTPDPVGGTAKDPDVVPLTEPKHSSRPLLPAAVMGVGEGQPCQVNLVYPCLKKKPATANWLVRMADCDCWDVDPEDTVKATCDACYVEWINPIINADRVECKCGTVYEPGEDRIADLVELR